jgi:rhodanese-related sulfurtransferase
MSYASVDEMLAAARSRISRLTPRAAADAVRDGALLVDIRPAWQRAETGEIPGAFVIERNHLEWRLDPHSTARVSAAADGQEWIVICAEGFTSSLAADSLVSIGVPAGDVDGGFSAWVEAGLPTVASGPTAHDQIVPGAPDS